MKKLLILGGALLLVACETHPAEIKIKGPKDAVELTAANPTFPTFEKKDDTLQLRASGFDDKGRYMGVVPVRWDSTERSVATISQTGLLTILSSGEATITATYEKGDVKREASLPVSAVIVKDIRMVEPVVEPGKVLEMAMEDIIQFKAEVLNDRGEVIPDAKVAWDASSYAVTVTPTGEVEGRAIGTAQVSAEAENGARARVEIEVGDRKPARRRR
ncbi:MAG: Ig-like domain-containing protein [Myxococcales bacterium]|nr:Ig-like domain-containing protein [Myxococcales bacterium]